MRPSDRIKVCALAQGVIGKTGVFRGELPKSISGDRLIWGSSGNVGVLD